MAFNQVSGLSNSIRTQSLTAVMRSIPALEPTASVSRALDLLRYGGIDTVPIADERGRFVGVVTSRELAPLVRREERETCLAEPLIQISRRPAAVGRAGMNVDAVRQILADSGETAIVIVDDRDSYLGIVTLADLLQPLHVRQRPAMIGGMATPWGVYLTNGSLQAGVGNWALVGAGAILGFLMIFSHAAVGLAAWAVQYATGWELFTIWNGTAPARLTLANCGWFLIHSLSLPLFFVLIRSIPLSKFHAAEHQAVHAMERGEPLRLEVVRRMPRVHPRCGTNLMAAGLIFGLVFLLVSSFRLSWLDPTDGMILGALAALFTWRSVGAWLQEYFTTSPASDRFLENGIRAGEELEDKYLATPPGRARLAKRIWCSGMAQTIIGASAASFAMSFLTDWVFKNIH